jgi:hypothetical protein
MLTRRQPHGLDLAGRCAILHWHQLEGRLAKEDQTMGKTMTAVFDGRVLHPDSPSDLTPDTRYRITVEEVRPPVAGEDAWDVLETLAGTVEAPADWAEEHDHYLYASPKHSAGAAP